MSVAVTTDYIAARRAALPAFPIAVTVNVDIEWSDIRSAGSAGLFGKFSYGRYGLREGFWRILEVLKVAGVPATFFVAPDDMDRHPSIVDDILRAGHEIAALGRVLEKPEQTGDGDLSSIEAAQGVFRRFTGSDCAGWRTANGLMTQAALGALPKHGYLYDSTFENDDLPYVFAEPGGDRLVELPVFNYLTDATFYGAAHGPERVRKAWKEEADALYECRGYVNLTLNQHGDYGSARGVRAAVVAQFLDAIGRKPGAKFLRCREIADLLCNADVPSEPFPRDVPVPMSV